MVPLEASAWLRSLPGGEALSAQEVARCGAALQQALAAWPGVEVDGRAWLGFVREKATGPAREVVAALETLQLSDLYLVFACARGEPRAVEALVERYLPRLEPVLLRTAGTRVDEARAALTDRLLLAREGSRPKIAEYSGRGALSAWLKVTAARVALRLGQPREEPALDERVFERASEGDAEQAFLKGRWRAEFDAAFPEALARLSDEERELLRRHFLEGVATAALAEELGVHRATAVRRLADARRKLLAFTREALERRVGREAGFTSVMRLIRSQLRFSLSHFLPGKAPP